MIETQHIKSLFFGQYLAHALRITVGIILPSFAFALINDLSTGLTLSLGAFYVSIADHPGPVTHRRTGMLVTSLLIFFMAIIGGVTKQYPLILAIEIPLFCFLFGMLLIFGARASSMGTAALLMMISSIYLRDNSIHFIMYAFLSFAGGIWYMILSLSLSQIRPYRQAQYDLGESILEVGNYLRYKAGFFNDKISVEQLYNKLILKQIKVNNLLDDVRQNVYRSRQNVNETMKSGRLVLMIFIDILALFEQAMSMQHDFIKLRIKYKEYDVLPLYRNLINKVVIEVKDLGYALINNEKPRPLINFDNDLEALKGKLDELEANKVSVFALKKILINIRNITRLLATIYNYFQVEQLTFLTKTEEADLTKFISHQEFDLKILKNNLSVRSSSFRHSIRLAIGCFLGFLISIWLPNSQHSFWILITILVILKPDFGLTKKRNYERVIGTLAGGLMGALILMLVQNELTKLILMIIFMIMAFSFNRTRYAISVLFTTTFILILLSIIYETSNLYLTTERVIYTIIGSAVAFASSFFILPTWESLQIKPYITVCLKANLTYLQQIISILDEKNYSVTSFRLARKDLYMQTAHLSEALQRMLHEPKNKQKSASYINEFVVLCHILSSYLASLSSSLEDVSMQKAINSDHVKLVRKTKLHLEQAISHIDENPFTIEFALPDIQKSPMEDDSDAIFIQKQLELIEKVATDILKLSETFAKLSDS